MRLGQCLQFVVAVLPQTSPVHSVRYDSSDDISSRVRTRRDIGSANRVVGSSTKSNVAIIKKNFEEISYPTKCSAVDNIKEVENKLSWDSLPSNLVNLGKEVLRQRDVAIQAAIEALQGACASQRLIRNLSTYSTFQLPEEDNLQSFVNKFLSLQEDLAHTRLITESLRNVSPVRKPSDVDHSSSGRDNKVQTLTQERNKNAASWIKSAVAMDISSLPNSCKTRTSSTTMPVVPANRLKISKVANTGSSKPKAACTVKKQKDNESHLNLAGDKEDQQLEWSRKGSCQMGATLDLVLSLQDESQRWFLNHVEKYLDRVENRIALMESEGRRAAMMFNIKRVSDWLDTICKEGSEGKESALNESEIEACHRTRKKIYGILMKHVERTAMGV